MPHEHELPADWREKVTRAGSVAGRALAHGVGLVREGARLEDVAEELEARIRKDGAKPAFPVNLSINHDAAHYSPKIGDPRTFRRGDLVKLDLGAHVDGFIGDTAATVEVGTDKHGRLVEASRRALEAAAGIAKDGLQLSQIGAAIEREIRGKGYNPIVNLTGHSIEVYHLHAGVAVPNVARGRGELHDGMVIAIEPFATPGAGRIREAEDGNIYHFLAAKPQRNPHAKKLLDHIAKEHPDLPFAQRWLKDVVPDRWRDYAMRLLLESGAISSYGVLREASGGVVSQAEHTLIVGLDKSEITTVA